MGLLNRRTLLTLSVAVIAVLIGTVSVVEFYEDIAVQGDPLVVAFGETTLGVALSVLLIAAALWVATELNEDHVLRMSRWFGLSLLVLVGGTGLIVGSQLVQAEVKLHLLVVNLLGIGILTALGVGYYDSVQQQQSEIIERERDQFAALFKNVPTAVIAVRHRGDNIEVEMINPAFEKVFGYSYEELEGTDVREVLRPPGEEPEPVENSSLTGLPEEKGGSWREVRVTLETSFGRREFVRISAPVDEMPDGPEEYAFYIDVTEQVQREERIQVLSRTLRHDLRNRLNIVQGNATLLSDRIEEDDKATIADQIDDAVEDLMSVAEKTRAFEELAAGQHERQPMEVRSLVETIVLDLSDRFPDCEFSVEIAEGIEIQGDPTLKVAFKNVIENAVVHNENASPTVEITADEESSSKFVRVAVTDNGPGIAEDISEVITGSKEQDSLHHSTGLGLWVSNWVIRNLGGELQISSNSPHGTVVGIHIPRPTEVDP